MIRCWWITLLAGTIVAMLAICFVVTYNAVAYTASSTAYSPCSAGQIMADGTHVRAGSVASNRHPFGTKLTITGPAAGRYVVRDRIGHSSDLDVWMSSCSAALAYGRRSVEVSVGWRPRRVLMGKVERWRHIRLPGKIDPKIGTAIVCDRRSCVESP